MFRFTDYFTLETGVSVYIFDMKKIFVAQLFLLFLSACEKTALSTADDSVNRPVVEAYLQPGHIPKVRITYQLAFGSDETVVRPIEGLNVTLETDGTARPLLFSTTDTAYIADGSWRVEAEKTYRLRFDYNGSTVTAETFVPQKPMSFKTSASSIAIPQFSFGGGGGIPTFPDSIEMTWANPAGDYYLVVVENIESNPESVFEDNGDQLPRFTFRSEPEQTNTYEVGFQSFQYYGTHRVVLFRINAEYASLYDDNGNSSQNLTTPYSNVVGGVGIFTGLNSDTLMVKATK